MSQKKLYLMFAMTILIIGFTAGYVSGEATVKPAGPQEESGAFSLGLLGGWAWPLATEAVEGFSETEFKSSPVYGGSMMYRFPGGFALEVCAEHLELDLEELGEDLGTLKMTPVMLLLKFQGMPSDGSGFTGHIDIGGGWNFTGFDKGSSITALEKDYGARVSVDTVDSFIKTQG